MDSRQWWSKNSAELAKKAPLSRYKKRFQTMKMQLVTKPIQSWIPFLGISHFTTRRADQKCCSQLKHISSFLYQNVLISSNKFRPLNPFFNSYLNSDFNPQCCVLLLPYYSSQNALNLVPSFQSKVFCLFTQTSQIILNQCII